MEDFLGCLADLLCEGACEICVFRSFYETDRHRSKRERAENISRIREEAAEQNKT